MGGSGLDGGGPFSGISGVFGPTVAVLREHTRAGRDLGGVVVRHLFDGRPTRGSRQMGVVVIVEGLV